MLSNEKLSKAIEYCFSDRVCGSNELKAKGVTNAILLGIKARDGEFISTSSCSDAECMIYEAVKYFNREGIIRVKAKMTYGIITAGSIGTVVEFVENGARIKWDIDGSIDSVGKDLYDIIE